MKNRLKKKKEKMQRQKIHKILDLVLDINGMGSREKSITGDLPTAFFDFSGHTSGISARIYRKGWVPGTSWDVEFGVHELNNKKLQNGVKLLEEEKRNVYRGEV